MKKVKVLLACCVFVFIAVAVVLLRVTALYNQIGAQRQFKKALESHNAAAIKRLLKQGVNPDTVFSDYDTDDTITVLKYKLLGEEPRLSERLFEERYTGVGYVTLHDDYEIAQLLLERGASANPKACFTGSTPLGIAAFQDHYKMCELLLRHGASPNGSCKGRTAMLCAKAWKDKKLILLLKKYGGKASP